MPTFVNLDAEYLWSLGQTFITDGDYDTGLRLCKIAEAHEKIDARLLHIVKDGKFAAGMAEAYARVYERSNLPPEERTMPAVAAKLLPQIKKIPTGMTAAKAEFNARKKPRKAAEPELSAETLAALKGIHLNLSLFKK